MNEKEVGQEPESGVIFEMNIYVKENGKIGFEVKANEDENLPDPIKMIGLLETIKMDIHAESTGGNNNGGLSEDDLVEVTLEDADFELPAGDQLKAMGKSVGDKVMMPKPIAFAREAMIADMKEGGNVSTLKVVGKEG